MPNIIYDNKIKVDQQSIYYAGKYGVYSQVSIIDINAGPL